MPRTKLERVSLTQLKAELARRQKVLPGLARQRAKLVRMLAALDRKIAKAAGEAMPAAGSSILTRPAVKGRKHRTGRPPRPGSLKAILLAAMANKKALSVPEAVKAATDGGYQSQSKNFRLLVNQTLLNEPEFRKVARGKYTAA